MEQKRVLLVVENAFDCEPQIDEMEESGLDVSVAGAADGAGIPVDDAIKRLEDGENFDMIISNMFMACGRDYLSLEETNEGWETGKAFAEYVRNQDIDTPILFYDVSTGMTRCDGYKASQGTVTLEQDDVVPLLLINDSNAADLAIKVNKILETPPAAPTDEIDFSL